MESKDSLQKTWIKFYPSYIDKNLKHSEGRKISNENSLENPTCLEIFKICAELLKLDCKMEHVNLI